MKQTLDWDTRYKHLREIADRIATRRRARAFKLARRYGMGDALCIHNASISEVGKGWGAGPGGRELIRAARLANRILDSQWDGFRVLERWDRRVRGY